MRGWGLVWAGTPTERGRRLHVGSSEDDDLGGGEESRILNYGDKQTISDLPDQDRDALKMEKFGKCHKVKPESGAGSYVHTLP